MNKAIYSIIIVITLSLIGVFFSFFKILPWIINLFLNEQFLFSYHSANSINDSLKRSQSFESRVVINPPYFDFKENTLFSESIYVHIKQKAGYCEFLSIQNTKITFQFKSVNPSIEHLTVNLDCFNEYIAQKDSSATIEKIESFLPPLDINVANLQLIKNNNNLFNSQEFPIKGRWVFAKKIHQFLFNSPSLELEGKLRKNQWYEQIPQFINNSSLKKNTELLPHFVTKNSTTDHPYFDSFPLNNESHDLNLLGLNTPFDFENNAYFLEITKVNLIFENALRFKGNARFVLNNDFKERPLTGQLRTQVRSLTDEFEPILVNVDLIDNDLTTYIFDSNNNELLYLPILFSKDDLKIINGRWSYPNKKHKLQGNIYLQAINIFNADPVTLKGRLNLITYGTRGKNTLVLSVPQIILKQMKDNIPFQLNGGVNFNDLVFTISIPGQLNIEDTSIKLLPGSLVRGWGDLFDGVYIEEVRLPLAGIKVNKSGLSGRLQAILKTREALWGQVELHLDGKAYDFNFDKGSWYWLAWGNGQMPLFEAIWDMKGKGKFENNGLYLSQLSTGLNQLKYGIVDVQKPRIEMLYPLRLLNIKSDEATNLLTTIQKLDVTRHDLVGGLSLKADHIDFRNGGTIVDPHLDLDVQGFDFSNFIYSGTLASPLFENIELAGRWDGVRLRGQAWWPVQNAAAFRHLFSKDTDLDVHQGQFRAQASYSAAPEQGFIMGGHLVFDDVNVRYKNNHIKALNFTMPYQFKNHRWHFGHTTPVTLKLSSLENIIAYENISLEFKGYYPFNNQYPLEFKAIHTDLLGGSLNMDVIRLPQITPTELVIEHLDTTRFWSLFANNYIQMTGSLGGNFKILFNDSDYLIKEGYLFNENKLTLQVDETLLSKMSKDSLVLPPVFDLIKTLNIDNFETNLSLTNFGDLFLESKIKATNTQLNAPREIILNYSHKENIYTLWQSLSFTDRLNYWLEETMEKNKL
ncbi:intermembrane phospholipid transport protein YdbH family protein [Thorsellia kenyensis]|uniref:YdbH domain-containing protein n=1 Tax=Thorsellia kenyensis TaxID=1549888 RepID=A0ABV6CAG5_9GAMM